jgi:glycosyltransferase EpsJ
MYPETYFIKDQKFNSMLLQGFSKYTFGPVSLCNKLYRKEIISAVYEINHPWRQDISEDNLINIGCFLRASSVYVIKEYLYEYVLNTRSCTLSTPSAAKFVGIYRAYAIAVGIYQDRGPENLRVITENFQDTLESREFSIDKLSELKEFDKDMIQAVNLIHDRYPEGLALIAARPSRIYSFKGCLNRALRESSKHILQDSAFYKPLASLVRTWRAKRLSFRRLS